jgi:cell division inhibitor SulA
MARSGSAGASRFRCAGCDHFRTDVSYLPDLGAYLDDPLRNRERLLACSNLDEWERREAMPSEEEISRVRRLIARVKAGLDDLTDDERTGIEEAVDVGTSSSSSTARRPVTAWPGGSSMATAASFARATGREGGPAGSARARAQHPGSVDDHPLPQGGRSHRWLGEAGLTVEHVLAVSGHGDPQPGGARVRLGLRSVSVDGS